MAYMAVCDQGILFLLRLILHTKLQNLPTNSTHEYCNRSTSELANKASALSLALLLIQHCT